MTAWIPVAPTTAAMAPNAPSGATHITMLRMRKTRIWMLRMPSSTGSPRVPSCCSAKPTRSATKRVCRMLPEVSDDSSDVGMMERRKSFSSVASVEPSGARRPLRSRPSPGWMRLPTTSPMASANVDMTMK
jgi:hypothetical protein